MAKFPPAPGDVLFLRRELDTEHQSGNQRARGLANFTGKIDGIVLVLAVMTSDRADEQAREVNPNYPRDLLVISHKCMAWLNWISKEQIARWTDTYVEHD